ncbi:MAG: YraN family protein [Gammaproteobacteria bacterium]|nr:YraN family protein [Gammaproteobacteria bacterium]
MTKTGILGNRAEKLAARYLSTQGVKIIERNYRCKLGEIDLIGLDGDCLVFIEVRYRKHCDFGTPADTVDINKQVKLKKAAKHYLLKQRAFQYPARFDVIGLSGSLFNARLEWIKNAID